MMHVPPTMGQQIGQRSPTLAREGGSCWKMLRLTEGQNSLEYPLINNILHKYSESALTFIPSNAFFQDKSGVVPLPSLVPSSPKEIPVGSYN